MPQVVGNDKHVLFSYSITDSESGEVMILEMDMGPGTPQTYINLTNLKLN